MRNQHADQYVIADETKSTDLHKRLIGNPMSKKEATIWRDLIEAWFSNNTETDVVDVYYIGG